MEGFYSPRTPLFYKSSMASFLLRRLAILPLALALVHFLGFAYAHQVRPLRAIRNPYLASATNPTSLVSTYTEYLRDLIRFDLGSMPDPWGRQGALPVAETIFKASQASFGLLAIALALSMMAGLVLGLWAARADPPSVARWLASLSTVGLAMPTFFIGSLFFAFWFLYVLWGGPGTVPLPLSGFGWDRHLVVPVIVLMARPVVQIAQVTAGLLAGELGAQYIVAARSLGHSWRAIRWRHALRNILAPVILTIAGSVRLLVGELIVVEWLFEWPGLGRLLAQTLIPTGIATTRAAVERILFLDPPVVAAVLAIFAALFLLTDLMASVLVKVIDPRLRET